MITRETYRTYADLVIHQGRIVEALKFAHDDALDLEDHHAADILMLAVQDAQHDLRLMLQHAPAALLFIQRYRQQYPTRGSAS